MVKEVNYSNSKLIEFMQEFSRENNNCTPTSRGMDSDKRYPSSATYRRRFGNWNNAVKKAGFKPNIERPSKKKYSDRELLQHLKTQAMELERAPTVKKIDETDGPCGQTYIERFGSWRHALEKIDLSPQRGYTEDKLFEFMEKLEEGLGRTPKYLDILDAEGYPSPMTYVNHFGSWNKAKLAFQESRKGMTKTQFNALDYIAKHHPNEVFDRDGSFQEKDIKKLEYLGLITSRTAFGMKLLRATESGKSIHQHLSNLIGSQLMKSFTKEDITNGLGLEEIVEKSKMKEGVIKRQLDELVKFSMFEEVDRRYRPSNRYQSLFLEFPLGK